MEPITNIQNQQSQISIEPLQALPEEMKMLIFSQLNEMDIEQASKIKPWNKIFVDVVKKQEFEKIKAFVNWTIAQLKSDDGYNNQYVGVKYKLEAVINGTKILESANLIDVKSSTQELEKQIIQILKELDQDTLMKLTHHKEKEPFNLLFLVAIVYKEIENVSLTDRYLDPRMLDFALELTNVKQYDVALEVSQYIPELKKQYILGYIIDFYIREGRIIKALDIMNDNLENMSIVSKKKSICNILNLPLKNGQIAKTMEVAITLLKMKDTDDLIKTTNAILFKNTCMIARRNYDFSANFPIFKTYLEELLNCEAPFSERDYIGYQAGIIPASILQNISLEFFKEGKEREAILVTKMIDDPVLQKQAFIAIKGEETSYCIIM